MNRAKIWGFTLLVLAAGAVNLYVVTQRSADQVLEQVGGSLRSATAQFESGARLFARQVSDVAVLAARDPELVAAVAEQTSESQRPAKATRRPSNPLPPVDVPAAAEKALRGAARALEVDASRAPLLAIASEGAVTFKVGDKVLTGKEPIVQAVLANPGSGRFARVEDALYFVQASPVAGGGTVAFGLPLEARWPERIKAATGADVTLLVGPKPVSTLPGPEVTAVVGAARKGAGATVDGGRLSPIRLPMNAALPAVPLLFAKAPAFRARFLALPGPEAPGAVLSAPSRALFEPLAVYQQLTLLALAVLLVTGVALGLLPERTVTAHVPRELAGAADRIARGDFEARVPRMSGTFGTLAAALNRAADAARMARVASGSLPPTGVAIPPATPANTLDVPMLAVPPPEEPAPGAGLFEDPFAAHAAASAQAPAAPMNGTDPAHPTPLPIVIPQRGSTARFQAAEPLAAQTPVRMPAAPPPPPPAPAPAESEETAWQGVFQEFLKVREECGESLEGLTWDRFRQKLQKNKDALVQKYACRTVRFQVYVKEGKAALKATPVR
ncbi:MAG TPA: MXAN_5187 family protein [Anaeromyxobacteraceae bacterium]|nr:MXAN_5187 family protein [Anaeromyxobacteraceae bacterium]